MNDNIIMGTEVTVEQLRAELERAAVELATERADRARVEERYAAFRRDVVETALAQAEERSWCDEVYDVLDGLGLDESDGIPPAEREETVTVDIRDLDLTITLERGQKLDTELVEDAFMEWVRQEFGNRHWSA